MYIQNPKATYLKEKKKDTQAPEFPLLLQFHTFLLLKALKKKKTVYGLNKKRTTSTLRLNIDKKIFPSKNINAVLIWSSSINIVFQYFLSTGSQGLKNEGKPK